MTRRGAAPSHGSTTAAASSAPPRPSCYPHTLFAALAGSRAPRPAHTLRRLALALTLATAALLALAATPAFAAQTHVFSTSFGASGSIPSNPYPLSGPSSVAVDSTSQATYVADPTNAWVEKFDSSGNLVWIIGNGVDQTNPGNLCTVASTDTCQPGTPGTGPGQFTAPTFVAVDNSATGAGDVYVADTGDNLVQKFAPDGTLRGAWGDTCATPNGQLSGQCATNGPFGPLAGIAVDTSGNLWVYDQNGEMFEFGQDGSFTTQWNSGRGVNPAGIAVDSATNLYVLTGASDVAKFSSSGTQIGDIGADLTNPTGIAIDSSTNDLYVDDGGSQIRHYAPSCDPSSTFCSAVDSFGSGDLSSAAGLAVDSSSSTVYAADSGDQRVDVFTGPVVLPDATTNAASNVTPTSATLNGTVNPDSTTITDCHFDYVDDAHYNASAPDPYSAGNTASCAEGNSFSSPTDVHADIGSPTPLMPGTTYHFRLQAANANGTNFGNDTTFPTPPPPSIDSISSQNVAPTAADLVAKINPNGVDTTYHFSYGTDTTYGTDTPSPDGGIGSGISDQTVTAHLSGLQPGVIYHYRLVAQSTAGTTTSLDHTFVYLTATPGLPDNRAYELVTPPFKGGARPLLGALSPDGSRVLIRSLGDFGDAGNSQTNDGVSYLATRTSSGWSSHNIDPPASQFPYDQYLDASPDLGRSLWYTRASAQSLYALDLMVRDGDGTLHDLGPLQPPSATAGPPGTGLPKGNLEYSVPYSGASADLSHVFFSLSATNRGFWPGDNTDTTGSQAPSLYEYVAGTGGPPALVGVDNGGNQISQCGVVPGANIASAFGGSQSRSVSAAGSTVFFTAGAGGCGTGGATGPAVDQLFAGIGDPGSGHATVNVAGTANCDTTASCDVTSPPTYRGASTDGSKVFFTISSDIYECDLPGDSGPTPTPAAVVNPCPHLRQISSGANVQSVNAISDDGSHVYFTATGVLTATTNQYGQSASSGANNLYLYERDAAFPSGQTSFIGTLNSPSPTAEATPDGRFLAFSDTAQLTPDDTSTALQVFRYDAQTGELVRISIGQQGFNDNGNTSTFDAGIPTPNNGVAVQRSPLAISNDGAYVVFQSADGLTPGALNGAPTDTPGVPAQNVYSYHAGDVALISDGRDAASDVGFSSTLLAGTTASGADIFFQSANPLVPQDTDTQIDIYDARIGGGFPPGEGAPTCSGDGCQGALSSSPSLPAAASITFSGPGNATPGATTPRVKILSRVVHGSTFLLKVQVPGRGRITVTGAGIRTVRKSVSKAGTYKLRVTLTAKEKKLLAHTRKLKLKLRVAYTPSSGTASAASVSLTVEPALSHKRGTKARRATSRNRGGAR